MTNEHVALEWRPVSEIGDAKAEYILLYDGRAFGIGGLTPSGYRISGVNPQIGFYVELAVPPAVFVELDASEIWDSETQDNKQDNAEENKGENDND